MAGSGDSWQYQGRQEHGWFGHGTGQEAANSSNNDGLFGPSGLADRAAAVTYGALGALPRELRARAGLLHAFGAAARLQALLVRWSRGRRLDKATFASQFFGRSADDRAVQALHAAATGIATARDQADLRMASDHAAAAMQAVGLGNWQRFLADAEERADDPATLAAVAASQPRPTLPTLATKAAAAPVKPAATLVDETRPTALAVSPAAAAEPAHVRIWQWLHGLGLTETRHEQAAELRRVMSAQGGLVYTRDGVPLNVEQMSDDEVLALDKETRGQPHAPPLIGAAAPIMTPWGWNGTPPYQQALKELEQPGTHETLNGRVPMRGEAERMIKDSGGRVLRAEPPHRPGRSTHNYYHINYETAGGEQATVKVQPWKE